MVQKAEVVIHILKKQYNKGGVTLKADTPFQLLIATILSAQCTDERVNQITQKLFKKFGKPEKLAYSNIHEIKQIIMPLGFYNQKASYIINTAKAICEKFNFEVPADRDSLESLPGVGRKTANIVLSRIFNIPAIAVDTHVKRVSSRLFGIAEKDPDKIEKVLMEILPSKVWNDVNLMLIFHGRAICKPRKPLCSQCVVNYYCKYFNKGETYEYYRH